MPAAISTATTPASRLARAPKITRVSTSRPFSSVPIQCASDGALRIAVHEVATGSYGAINGANTATPMNSTITARPATATGRCRKRRTASCAGLRGIAAVWTMDGATMVVLIFAASSPSQPRIDHHVEHIRRQVQHHIKKRRHQHDPLHHRIVAVEHRIDHHLAEARNAEHLLGQHRARK